MHASTPLSSLAAALLLVLPAALAQVATPPTLALPSTAIASATTGSSAPQNTDAANSADVEAIVTFLIPSITSTSLSPSQSAAVLSAGSSFLSSYTSASPLASLQNAILGDVIFASTTPDAQQQSAIRSLLAAAPTALVQDPEGLVRSVSSAVAPFGFATRIEAYELGFRDGLATAVASQLGVSPPPALATQGAAGADEQGAGARGAVAGLGLAVGAAVGVVGLVL